MKAKHITPKSNNKGVYHSLYFLEFEWISITLTSKIWRIRMVNIIYWCFFYYSNKHSQYLYESCSLRLRLHFHWFSAHILENKACRTYLSFNYWAVHSIKNCDMFWRLRIRIFFRSVYLSYVVRLIIYVTIRI